MRAEGVLEKADYSDDTFTSLMEQPMLNKKAMWRGSKSM